MQPAQIRYFAALTLDDRPLPACAYLAALDKTGLGVRMLSIFGMPSSPGPWSAHASAFLAPVAARYVNVVAAMPDTLMGHEVKRKDLAGGFGGPGELFNRADFSVAPPGMEALAAAAEADPDEVIYTPQTIFAGLYTVGVPNVAITAMHPTPRLVTQHEIAALKQYDLVLTPTSQDHHLLALAGVGETTGDPTLVTLGPGSDLASAVLGDVLRNLLAGRKPLHVSAATGFDD